MTKADRIRSGHLGRNAPVPTEEVNLVRCLFRDYTSASRRDIERASGLPYSRVRTILDLLVAEGYIVRRSSVRWASAWRPKYIDPNAVAL